MQIIAHQVITLSEVDSTNNYAANLLNTTKPAEGTVIMAHKQYAGRGQRGSEWLSNAQDNLTFSLLLYPKLKVTKQFLLSQVVALSLVNAIKEFTKMDAVIKWPNDILVNEKKVAGVLIENTSQGDYLSSSVVGIGINVNQIDFQNLPKASSLALELGVEINKKDFLKILYAQLDWWYKKLCLKQELEIENAYLTKLWRHEQQAWFLIDGNEVQAIIKGTDDAGRLKLSIDGEFLFFGMKELVFIW